MDYHISWNGKWTHTTLVEFANEALGKLFLKDRVTLCTGFTVNRNDVRKPVAPSEVPMLHRTILINGRTEKYGKVRIEVLTLIEMDVHMPVSVRISCKGKKLQLQIVCSDTK